MYWFKSYKCRWIRVSKGGETFNLDDTVPAYGVSSREIFAALNKANEELKIKNILYMFIAIT